MQLEAAKGIVKASDAFVRGFDSRKLDSSDFPKHLKAVLPGLRAVSAARPDLRLDGALEAIEKSLGSVAGAQRAHRDILLLLNRLRDSTA
jgi:hypothetical protein